MTTDTDRIDTADLTVIRTDRNGEDWDLNAGGEPLTTSDELRAFVAELSTQGYYGADVHDELLSELA